MQPSRLEPTIGACFAAAALLAGCASSTSTGNSPTVPQPFASACGHPGAEVTVSQLPVTVRHKNCVLTGVVVHYGEVGLTIPDHGEVGAAAVMGATAGSHGPLTLSASVDPATGDVTITP